MLHEYVLHALSSSFMDMYDYKINYAWYSEPRTVLHVPFAVFTIIFKVFSFQLLTVNFKLYMRCLAIMLSGGSRLSMLVPLCCRMCAMQFRGCPSDHRYAVVSENTC